MAIGDADYDKTVLLLHLDAVTAVDSSSVGRALTVGGGARIQSLYRKYGSGAAAFDGSGDYFLTANTADLMFGSSDYTVEAWIYKATAGSARTIVCVWAVGGLCWWFGLDSSERLAFYYSTDGTTGQFARFTSGAVPSNQWAHVAASKTGGTFKLFIDGVSGYSAADSTTLATVSTNCYVGAQDPATNPFTGYIDDLRITKGTGRYSSNFTPPAAALPEGTDDPNWSDVKLLCHMDGADELTDYVDSSYRPKTVLPNGGAAISVAQSKWGNAALALPGTNGNRIAVVDGYSDFGFGVEDFTVEFWIYLVAGGHGASTPRIMAFNANATTGGLYIVVNASDNPATFVVYLYSGSYTSIISSATTLANNTWGHFALTRASGVYKAWLNGTQYGSTNSSNTSYSHLAGPVYIGCNESGGEYLNGYLDDIRVTRGLARYTASFTAPTAAHPAYMGQVSGTVYDSAGAPAQRTVRAIRRVDGALVASTVSNATTGAYTLNCPTLEEVCRIVHDDAAGTLFNDLIDRVIPA